MNHHTHCPPHVTPETCESILISFVGGVDLIQRRDRPTEVKPIVKGKRLTQLVPGDMVEYRDEAYEVEDVVMYR